MALAHNNLKLKLYNCDDCICKTEFYFYCSPLLIAVESGCSKTRLLSFIPNVSNIPMYAIDVYFHGGIRLSDLAQDLTFVSNNVRINPTKTTVVFLDEIDASPEIDTFGEVAWDHSSSDDVFSSNLAIQIEIC